MEGTGLQGSNRKGSQVSAVTTEDGSLHCPGQVRSKDSVSRLRLQTWAEFVEYQGHARVLMSRCSPARSKVPKAVCDSGATRYFRGENQMENSRNHIATGWCLTLMVSLSPTTTLGGQQDYHPILQTRTWRCN
jgi:hypothetical protein